MAREDNSQLCQSILQHLNISVDLQGQCKETFRKLETGLQTLIERIEDNRIDKDSQEFRDTVEFILSKVEFYKYPDNLKQQIRLKIEKLEILNKKHELEKFEHGLRERPGRRRLPVENDSAYGSATSKTFTDSNCQTQSFIETVTQTPSSDQASASYAVVPSCSSMQIEFEINKQSENATGDVVYSIEGNSSSVYKKASEHDEATEDIEESTA